TVDFGVRGRVGVAPDRVVGGGNDFVILDDHRAERGLPGGNSLLGLLDSQTHVIDVRHERIPSRLRGRSQTATLSSGCIAGRAAYSLSRRRTSSLVAGRFSLG